MSGGNYRAALAALLIGSPADLVCLAAHLHSILIFVPGTDAPDGIV